MPLNDYLDYLGETVWERFEVIGIQSQSPIADQRSERWRQFADVAVIQIPVLQIFTLIKVVALAHLLPNGSAPGRTSLICATKISVASLSLPALNSCRTPCHTSPFSLIGICRGLATHLLHANPQLISFLQRNLAGRRVARLHHEDLRRLVQHS